MPRHQMQPRRAAPTSCMLAEATKPVARDQFMMAATSGCSPPLASMVGFEKRSGKSRFRSRPLLQAARAQEKGVDSRPSLVGNQRFLLQLASGELMKRSWRGRVGGKRQAARKRGERAGWRDRRQRRLLQKSIGRSSSGRPTPSVLRSQAPCPPNAHSLCLQALTRCPESARRSHPGSSTAPARGAWR